MIRFIPRGVLTLLASLLLCGVVTTEATAQATRYCANSVTVRSSPSWSGAAIGTTGSYSPMQYPFWWEVSRSGGWSYGTSMFYLYDNPGASTNYWWWGYVPTQFIWRC